MFLEKSQMLAKHVHIENKTRVEIFPKESCIWTVPKLWIYIRGYVPYRFPTDASKNKHITKRAGYEFSPSISLGKHLKNQNTHNQLKRTDNLKGLDPNAPSHECFHKKNLKKYFYQ